MNLETFKKIIDEIGDGLFAIALWNYGEPLLNPEIFSMISYARRKSIITAISTNALSLNQEKIGRIFDSGLDFLIISFDGATKETYEKFRGEGNFDKVLSNLTLLMEMKKRQSRNKPFVDLQFIVMKENEHQIDDMRALAEKICVDKLSLKKFTYVGGEETWRFLPDKKKYLFGKYKGYKYKGSCLRVIDSSVVLWDGTIVPCCGDLSFKYKFGNVNSDGGFMNIWNNNKYVAFRKTVLKDVQALEICRSCPSKDYNADMFI